MTTAMVPLSFVPDLDNAWSVLPGAVSNIFNMAPLVNGAYGSVGITGALDDAGEITGVDELHGQMFRKIDGTVRFLVFRKSDIDEYNDAAVRTNQGTGYSSGTTAWTAAGFGNAIVACNYLDATQVSTGTTFSALGGGSPKARLVAANSNFVMLADYDDGINQYGDGWWCSAIGNYTSWTASLSTQAANGRILECSGPIKALVPFKDGFIAFKADSIHAMDYIGPPAIWSVRTIANHVGCVGPHAVCEFAGKLYFAHQSGFWSYDGSSLVDVGGSVIKQFLSEHSYVLWSGFQGGTGTFTSDLSKIQAVADDVENVVWFGSNTYSVTNSIWHDINYGFNVSTGKWGTFFVRQQTGSNPMCYVLARTSEVQSFKAADNARLMIINPWRSTAGSCRILNIGYPAPAESATWTISPSTIKTGIIGSINGSNRLRRVYWRSLYGSATTPFSAITAYGFSNEAQTIANGSDSSTMNSELDCADLNINARFMRLDFTGVATEKVSLAGIGLEFAKGGER